MTQRQRFTQQRAVERSIAIALLREAPAECSERSPLPGRCGECWTCRIRMFLAVLVKRQAARNKARAAGKARPMISASALARNCGYARVLSAARPRPATTVEAADRGTAFHKAIEGWIQHHEYPQVDDLEIQGWIDLLASQWTPDVTAECELAWGLTPDGNYVEVTEPEPHKYVAPLGWPLLTAGRADLAFERRGVLYVVDWKTGKWPVTPAADNLQVNAAGIALAQKYGATSYCPAVYYVRDGAFDEGDDVPLGSREHEQMFEAVKTAALLGDEPRPGPWCSKCWERKQCPEGASGEGR